jgi:hypothetical protein
MTIKKKTKRAPRKRRMPKPRSGGPPALRGEGAEAGGKPFDEPATPARPQGVEDVNVCGGADEARTDPSDLH